MKRTIEEELKESASDLASEFRTIRDHPRIREIFEGYYIYDSSLTIPSKNFILLITFALLRDTNFLAELNEMDVESGRIAIVERVLQTKDDKVSQLAEIEIRRRLIVRQIYPDDSGGNGAADWNGIVHQFRHGVEGTSVILRSICQKALELLVARAVLLGNFKSLERLAVATREDHFDRLSESTSPSREITFHLLRDLPELEQFVSWKPSKEAIKFYILAKNPWLSDNSTTWAKVWKKFPADYANQGTRLTEERRAELTALAKKDES